MEEIRIRDAFIRLGQALKLAGIAETGAEAKEMILQGKVTVGGEVCLQRGKKCHDGDVIEAGGRQIVVRSENSDDH